MRLGISSWAFPWSIGASGMQAEQLLGWAHNAGLGLVQIADNLPLRGYASSKLKALRDEADRVGISFELGMRGMDLPELSAHIEIAKLMDAKLIRTLLPGRQEHACAAVIAQLKKIVPLFEQAEIVLAIENYEQQSSECLARIVKGIDSPFLRICLDTTNSVGALEMPHNTVEILAPFTSCLHIKDFGIERIPDKLGFLITGRPAGQGRLDIPLLLDRVLAKNPKVSVVLEQWPPFEDSLEATEQKEHEWATEGIRYLRGICS